MKPRIVPQPFEDRKKLRGLVAQWQQQVEDTEHNPQSMDHRIAKTMLVWLEQRLAQGNLYWSNRDEWRRQTGRSVNRSEHRRQQQIMNKWNHGSTLD